VHNALFAPWIGVAPQFFLTDAAQRRRAGLSSVNLAEDESAGGGNRNFLAPDSDFVGFGLTLSTSADQIAVAPGILKREWVEAGRRYFRFEADRPINNFWAVQSARYEVAKRAWGNIELAVYHDAAQRRNVPQMLVAMQEALAYYTETYGPYSYGQLRIAEFPYGAYAQSFPSAISYAETLGFSRDSPAGGKVDHVGFVTAHEVAHQWWGHQAVPADKPGAQFLSETLAEYSALMVMEKRYGPDRIRGYLKTDLDQYLSRRGQSDAEQPVAKVLRHQAHIAYQKGALAMYALKDAIGQQAVDRALRRYLEKYRDRFSPYPTSADLIGILREEAGPDHQSLISDLFEKIIFWEFKAVLAVATSQGDGRWRVLVTVTSDKQEADPTGAETSVPLVDAVDIGLFAADPSAEGFTSKDVIALEKRVVTGGTGNFEFFTDRRPAFLGVNPYLKLIERQSRDNIIAVAP
jgi:aminopeptidase N